MHVISMWMNILFFCTVCSSFRGFKWYKNWETLPAPFPKIIIIIIIICQTTKIGKFVKPQKQLSNLQTQKKDLAKFQNQKNIERASLSNFERWPLGQITCSALIQLAKRFLASWIFLHDSAQTPLTYNKEL